MVVANLLFEMLGLACLAMRYVARNITATPEAKHPTRYNAGKVLAIYPGSSMPRGKYGCSKTSSIFVENALIVRIVHISSRCLAKWS